MGIEPLEDPPIDPGQPAEPPLETPPGNPSPEVPTPIEEPDLSPPPDELPGGVPEELPMPGPSGPGYSPPTSRALTNRSW
jgi:hypothetical protein